MILSQVQTGIPPNAASPILPRVAPHLPTPSRTSAVAVVILVPPEAPTTIFTFFILSTKMEGHIEDIGCLPVGRTGTTQRLSFISAAHRLAAIAPCLNPEPQCPSS